MIFDIIPGKKKRSRWLWPAGALFLFALLAFLIWSRNLETNTAPPLTATERAWLKNHPVIRLAPDPDFPPIEYFAKEGGYSGITADYVALLEKKLGIRFEIVSLRDWGQIISKAKSRRIDAFVASATPQRAEYMLFTHPFLELPAVIIAREKVRVPLNLEKLSGMRVSVVSGYATHDFIAGNFPKLRLDPVPDVRTGLRKVSFGLSDAFVENLATTSYYIEKDGIANLRIAGESGYFYKMGFCSRNDWPELNSILEKGLASISAREKKAIYNRWIPLEHKSLFTSREFQTGLFVVFAAILLTTAGVIAWNRMLAKKVRLRTRELENELAERRQAEDALRESEQRFRVLTETSPVAIIVFQGENIVYVNPAATRLIGYTEQECQQMNFWDWAHEDYKEEVKKKGLARQQGEVAPSQYEVMCVTKNGEEKWIYLSAGHIEFGGTPAGIVSIIDITELKRMGEELERAREELEKRVIERTAELARTTETLIAVEQEKNLFLNVTDALVVYFDPEMNIRWANRAACESVGMPREELQQRHCWETWHQRREPCAGCPVILARDTGEVHEAEMRSPDGRVWFICGYPVKDKTGRITGIVEFCQDFTERKKAEEQLLLSQFCIDKAAIGIYHTTPEGDILSANEFACKSLGYTADELLALKVPDIDPVITSEKTLEIKESLESTGSVTHESVHRRKDGTAFPVEIVTSTLEFQGKSYAFSFVKNITGRKRTENINMARLRLLQFAATHSLDELLEATLDEAEALTGSLIGFYHFLEADQKTLALQNWSSRTKAEFCKAEGKGSHYAVSAAGVWADCIRERRPIIHNDYASLPDRKGLPPGHAQVVRELVVPVFRGGNIVAILGLGNKPLDYTSEDMEAVSLLADLAWEIAERKKMEEELFLNAERMDTLLRLNQMTGATLDKITGFAFEAAVKMTRSRLGYLAFMNEDETVMSMQLWSREAMDACRVPRNPRIYPVEMTGLWGEAVRQRRPVITNDYAAANPWKKGTPEGHVRITRHMNLPVIVGGKIVLVAGVGNKEEDYNEADVNQLTLLMEGMWRLIERKRAEEALREANLVVENSPVVLFRWKGDDGWPVELVSTNIIQFGYEPDEFLSGAITYSSIIHPDDLDRVTREVHAYCSDRAEQFRLEYRIMTKWGNVRWVSEHTNVEREDAGNVTGFEGIVIDVTERKLAEEALLSSEREKSLILNITDAHIIYYDLDMNVLWANKAAGKSANMPLEDLGRRRCWEVWHHRREPCADCPVLSTRYTGNPREAEIRTPDNRVWFIRAYPVRNETEQLIGMVEFTQDITERKLANEELARQKHQLQELNSTLEKRVQEEVAKNREKDIVLIQQNRQAALGEMLDHTAHQWKQPLNSIALIVQYMGEIAFDTELTGEFVVETVGRIMDLLDHMTQTIDIFRGFFRPDKEKKFFNMRVSIDQTLAFIAPAFTSQSIVVELDVAPGLSAYGYQNEYAQVLLNILANARDAFKARQTEKPRVVIKGFTADDKTVVTIMDNAGGIPEGIIGKIFDIYFTTNEAGGGTGIGLYMSKNIIEKNMDGTLSAENTDGGARFRIEIPST